MKPEERATDSSLLELPVQRLAGPASYAVGFAALLILWWLAALSVEVRTLLPSPLDTARAFGRLVDEGALAAHAASSVLRVLVGFVIGCAVAIPLGLLMGLVPRAERAIEPLVELFRPVPPYAMIPLALLWFGTGPGGKIYIIMYAVFFPILLSTIEGVSRADAKLVEAARTLGASSRFVLLQVVLPAAAPQILVGLRIGFGSGWLAVVAAEMVASASGLGFMIADAREMLRTDVVVATMLLIGAIGYSFNRVFLLIARSLPGHAVSP
jgi:ABC-type nitrate/sulfonate/bicarbonate transport system permease component